MKKYRIIRVSEDTHKLLMELRSDFMKVHGEVFSFDDVISDCLEILVEKKASRENGKKGGRPVLLPLTFTRSIELYDLWEARQENVRLGSAGEYFGTDSKLCMAGDEIVIYPRTRVAAAYYEELKKKL